MDTAIYNSIIHAMSRRGLLAWIRGALRDDEDPGVSREAAGILGKQGLLEVARRYLQGRIDLYLNQPLPGGGRLIDALGGSVELAENGVLLYQGEPGC